MKIQPIVNLTFSINISHIESTSNSTCLNHNSYAKQTKVNIHTKTIHITNLGERQ